MSGSPASSDNGGAWPGRHVLVAVTGGIASYKSASLVSRLVQKGADVHVAMTKAACRFVGPLTFQALSGRAVTTDIWPDPHAAASPHIDLARQAHLLIIAPATADCIARLAAGLCDDIVCLTASALPRTTPVLLAPAMNEQMWQNPVTRRNLATARDLLGYHTVGPQSGWQACRTVGEGRMAEADQIFEAAATLMDGSSVTAPSAHNPTPSSPP